ncbi:SDR family oxidoreductase [Mycolicibacterium sp.]|uniref:SDR family oxidoreductase n=1 Tax=Mycolicibacterium sp. TaxID=2320850 RepID=UPI003D14B255
MTARTWFITGTTSGFGRELTEQLLARGDRVTATARNPEPLQQLQSRHRDQLRIAVLDVTDTSALRRALDAAFEHWGRVDVVVSNAGYGLFGAAEELSDADIERQLVTNLVAPIQLARAATPHFRAHGGGTFVQLSSLGGQAAYPGMSVYHASKWGVEGFFESYAAEVAGFGIQTIIVEPGMARTAFSGRSAAVAAVDPAYDGSVLRAEAVPVSAQRGDPRKVAAAIIAAADMEPSPLRLALGSDAYAMIGEALRTRLGILEAQKSLALSTDSDDFTATD